MILFFTVAVSWFCLYQGFSIVALKNRIDVFENNQSKETDRKIEKISQEYLTLCHSSKECARLICELAKMYKGMEAKILEIEGTALYDETTVVN